MKPTRSRRRSSRLPAERSKTKRTRTQRGVCSHERRRRVDAQRVHRPLRNGRAQLVLDQTLRVVGDRVLLLDGGEHAHDRVHRQGRRGHRRSGEHRRSEEHTSNSSHPSISYAVFCLKKKKTKKKIQQTVTNTEKT